MSHPTLSSTAFLVLIIAASYLNFCCGGFTFEYEKFCDKVGIDGMAVIPRQKPLKVAYRHVGHRKMYAGFRLMCDAMNWTSTEDLNEADIDILWETMQPNKVHVKRGILYLFGPEMVILPDEPGFKGVGHWNTEVQGHVYYTTMSDWNVVVHEDMGGMPWPLISFPFAVDIDTFKSNVRRADRTGVMVMFKKRDPSLLQQVEDHLKGLGVQYTLFSYTARYKEEDYKQALRTAALGIWIGDHESQGFGFQEALSNNVPLLVLDATDMRQERFENGGCPFCHYDSSVNLAATSASTWSPLCGEKVFTFEEYERIFPIFVHNVRQGLYQPRIVVEQVLSPQACGERLSLLYDYHRELSCKQYLVEKDGKKYEGEWNNTLWFSTTAYRSTEDLLGY